MITENVGKPGLNQDLAELALKVEAELSEDLRPVVSFSQDAKGECLVVDWAVQLKPEDLKALTDIAVRYGGAYVNLPDNSGKDRGCFQLPKPKPVQAVLPAKKVSPLKHFEKQNCVGCEDEEYCAKNKGKVQLCLEIQQVELLKAVLSEQNRQAFQVYNKILEHMQKTPQTQNAISPAAAVAPKVEAQKPLPAALKPKGIEDIRMLFPTDLDELLAFEQLGDHVKVSPRAFLGADNFAKIKRVIEVAGGEYVSAGKDSHFRIPAARSANKPAETVPRNTRPLEGHVDLGIVWTHELGQKGEYEKASEKDNMGKEAYFQLYDWIVDHEEKPFQNGFFYWIFEERNAIARRLTQQRGRR